MKKFFLIALLSLSLGGCIYEEVKLSDNHLKSIKKVGLVSLLPNDANFHYVGFTVFNNAHNSGKVNGLNANQVAYDVASSELKKNGVEVVRLSTANSLLKGVYKTPFSKPNKKALQSDLEKFAKAANVNHIAVIYSNVTQDRIGGSSEFNAGYGLFKRFTGAPNAYASLSVDVMRVAPFETLISSEAIEHKRSANELWLPQYGKKAAGFLDIPKSSQTGLVAPLNMVISESVSNALKYSGLTR